MAVVAVASPPTRIQSESHQVCKTKFSAGACRTAALQRAKLLKVDRRCPLRSEICVEKVLVSEFVVGIVVDILGHVRVQHRKSIGEGWIAASTRLLLVLNSRQFVVLHPEVRLQNLRGCGEPKQGGISSRKTLTFIVVRFIFCQSPCTFRQKSHPSGCGPRCS